MKVPDKGFSYRSGYNYDWKKASVDSGLICLDPSRAVQSQKEEADINTIVERFNVTGELPKNVRMPSYGDFTGTGSYQEALEAISNANKAFMAYPANIRERFHHSPEEFIEFFNDPKNLEEGLSLGLLYKKGQAAAKEDTKPKAEATDGAKA
jgi:phage internal scaffolding protein